MNGRLGLVGGAAPVVLRVGLWLVAAGMAGDAVAARFCVADAEGLTAALAAAAGNGEDNEILLRQGIYFAPAGGWRIDLLNGAHSLDLAGGHTDAACARRSADAALTVLDGKDLARPLSIETSGSFGAPNGKHINVSGLTFRNGRAEDAAGLKVSDPGPIYGGTILVEGNVFLDNTTTSFRFGLGAGALLAATDGPDFNGGTGLVVRNNLFAGNSGPNAAAMYLFSNNLIEVGNNTVAGNRATDAALGERVAVGYFTLTGIRFSNNVFWDNNPAALPQTYDLRLDDNGQARAALVNNLLQSRVGTAVSETGSVGGNPVFADTAARNYAPGAGSPLVDAGSDTSTAGLPPSDVAGHPRVAGTQVDIGAYERDATRPDAIFADGFDG